MKRLWARMRQWPLWSAPPVLIGYLLALVAVFVALSALGLASTERSARDLAVYCGLLACAWICGEASRRLGEAAGLTRDLQSAWTLPIAFLLPPVYGLLAPVPLRALNQLRVGRSLVYRRVLSASAVGLAHYAASSLFHRLSPDVRGAVTHGGSARVVLTALACATLCYLINTLLVTAAVRLSTPTASWWQLLFDPEALYVDLVEVCMGTVVFAGWLFTPLVTLVLLPPALLLQRSLTYVQLRTAARTDAKTGLLNAVAWQQESDREIVRATRERRPLAVLMVDVDLFKRFNDTYGHLAGDQALFAVARSLAAGLRGYDTLGRFGGEEFAVVLPNTDQDEAGHVAERLRQAVTELALPGVEPSARLTVCIGVAMLDVHGTALIDLLTAADHALYEAKAAGRNRVSFAPGLPTPRLRSAPLVRRVRARKPH